MYISWYMCLSIFFDSRYLRSKRLRTRILLIQRILVGSLASLVPFLLPIHHHKKKCTILTNIILQTNMDFTCMYTSYFLLFNYILRLKMVKYHIQNDVPSSWPPSYA
jgi:hypothetical protein